MDDSGVKWFIPLFISTGGEPQLYTLKDTKRQVVVDLPHPGAYVSLNYHGRSMCRVKYSGESLKRIIGAVELDLLSVPDKSSLLSDTLSFMKSGTVSHE